jgi:hypothetical protein
MITNCKRVGPQWSITCTSIAQIHLNISLTEDGIKVVLAFLSASVIQLVSVDWALQTS